MSWKTENEIEFITNLGTGKYSPPKVNPVPRVEMLKRYLKTCYMRKNWDEIDKKKVIRYTKGLIASIK